MNTCIFQSLTDKGYVKLYEFRLEKDTSGLDRLIEWNHVENKRRYWSVILFEGREQ